MSPAWFQVTRYWVPSVARAGAVSTVVAPSEVTFAGVPTVPSVCTWTPTRSFACSQTT
jgi:hypothetical protein